MKRLRALAALTLCLAAAHAEPGQPSEKWETLKGCRLLRNDWNDGDSFHISHNGREYIFRLYFVDTPEVHDVSPHNSRTTEQAKYWGVTKKELAILADDAARFSAETLTAGTFTVRTKWEDARGESQLPRNFAVIETAGGDLAELLVANGLARIYGHHIDHPRGVRWPRYQKVLADLEQQARRARAGAWAYVAGAGPAPKTAKSAPKKEEEEDPASPLNNIPAF